MTDLSHISADRPIEIEGLRQRLVKMTDAELRKFGEASRFMRSPRANLGRPPRDVFIIQLYAVLMALRAREIEVEGRRKYFNWYSKHAR